VGKIEKFKKIAKDKFLQGEYEFSLLNYSFALNEVPNDKEAKMGAILCDIAFEREEEAIALFDFYEFEKKTNSSKAEERISEIINSNENSFEGASTLFNQNLKMMIDEAFGISYEDFQYHIKTRGSFKIAFEELMFSSRIIINKKEDLLDFIFNLIKYDFNQIAYNYIENASKLFFNKKDIEKLFTAFEEKEKVEN